MSMLIGNYIIEIYKERRIEVYGVCFSGVSELKKVTLSGNPKNAVYVGVQMERYPCFDSFDYAYENRYYTHFVFARSKEELELKLDVLNNPEKYKGIDKRRTILAPMVYWNGDIDDPMVVPECDEILVHEKREKIKPFTTQQCKDKARLERLIERLKQYK